MRPLAVLFTLALVIRGSVECPDGWRQSPINKNNCYKVVVSKKIWFEAESFCQAAAPNSHLTSIMSAYETYSLNAIVTDTPSISACDQLWIGANDFDQNGQFVWSNGNPFQYTKWGAGQPDLNNQCVSSQARTTGSWKTEPCGTENCFICEQQNGGGSTMPPSTTTTTPAITTAPSAASDCYDWLHIYGATTSGIYRINPPRIAPFDVYCDMDTNGGGWTVFQKRIDDSQIFYTQKWAAYKAGFGNGLNRNYWLGNDRLHILTTKDQNVQLHIDLWNDRSPNSDNPNGYWFGEFIFSIDDEAHSYTLHISNNTAGNATSLLAYNNNQPFSTPDRDQSDNHCTSEFGTDGAWWFSDCTEYVLNGKYTVSDFGGTGGLSWAEHRSGSSTWRYPTMSHMKLRKMP